MLTLIPPSTLALIDEDRARHALATEWAVKLAKWSGRRPDPKMLAPLVEADRDLLPKDNYYPPPRIEE